MSRRLYEVIREPGLAVPMRDGTTLMADLYLPGSGGRPLEGPLPVLLERTPYSRRCDDFVRCAYFFTRRGYAVMLQDVRGRFESGGEFDPFGPAEVQDGADTVGWIVAQPWSNGKVGTMGTSYMAYTQVALGMANPPGLAAQFLSQGFSNHYHGRLRQGGAARLDIGLVWAVRLACTSKEAQSNPLLQQALYEAEKNVDRWLGQVPLRKGQSHLHQVPALEQYVLDVTTRGEKDEYWEAPGRDATDAWDTYPDLPIYLLGSWYDSHSMSTAQAYTELSKRQRTSPLRMIMGPWIHGLATPTEPFAGEVHFGMDAAIEYDNFRLAFFESTLGGEETAVFDGPPVQIFVMGGGGGGKVVTDLSPPRIDHGGHWRSEWEWPLARTRYTPFYLQPNGGLSSVEPPASTPSSFRYDPLDPVPTVGGQLSSTFSSATVPGGFDQTMRAEMGHRAELPLAARPDVLVFQTEPLAEAVEVTGPIEVRLFVSSSAPDTDFTAKLVDVYAPSPNYPGGFALNLSDGIIRARYRNSSTCPEWLEPGEVYEVRIEMPPTSNLFAKGHCIRIDISSSNFPRFDRNFNTQEPVGQARVAQVAINTVYHDPEYRSHIVLPLIPLES